MQIYCSWLISEASQAGTGQRADRELYRQSSDCLVCTGRPSAVQGPGSWECTTAILLQQLETSETFFSLSRLGWQTVQCTDPDYGRVTGSKPANNYQGLTRFSSSFNKSDKKDNEIFPHLHSFITSPIPQFRGGI